MANDKRHTADWVKAFTVQNEKNGNYPPGYPGKWKTFHELHDEHMIGNNKLRRMLTTGVEDGTFEAFEGTAPNVTGRLCRSVWYRPV
jgi:hypothetical protein